MTDKLELRTRLLADVIALGSPYPWGSATWTYAPVASGALSRPSL
ncbi:hypothetical protein [Streptomyces sp. NPDC088170]